MRDPGGAVPSRQRSATTAGCAGETPVVDQPLAAESAPAPAASPEVPPTVEQPAEEGFKLALSDPGGAGAAGCAAAVLRYRKRRTEEEDDYVAHVPG
jgi:hypothetical protein